MSDTDVADWADERRRRFQNRNSRRHFFGTLMARRRRQRRTIHWLGIASLIAVRG